MFTSRPGRVAAALTEVGGSWVVTRFLAVLRQEVKAVANLRSNDVTKERGIPPREPTQHVSIRFNASFFDALVGSIEIGGASSLGCEETDGGAVFVVNSGA